MLGSYLASRFEFHTRAQLLDANMEYLNLFSVGENKVDVAATFIRTYPKIVLKIGDTKYIIPYIILKFIYRYFLLIMGVNIYVYIII